MENSIGLKRANIYTSLPGKANRFSNIEIHCMSIPDFQFTFLDSCGLLMQACPKKEAKNLIGQKTWPQGACYYRRNI